MTTTELRDTGSESSTAPAAPSRPRLQLSVTQLVASALAAVTATVAGSYLGVSGTVVGAAVASVLTVAGNAIYGHSLRQTGHRVRTAVPAGTRWLPAPGATAALPTVPTVTEQPVRHTTSLRVLAAACAGVFIAVLLVVTGVELAAGRPISDLVTGKDGTGTTLLGDSPARQSTGPLPTPTVTVTVTPSVVTVTPTITQTAPAATHTVPASTTATATATGTPTPTVTATPTPTPTATTPTP